MSELPRRDFLMLAWQGMTGLAAVGMGFITLRFLASRVGTGVFGGMIAAGAVADFPPGSVTPITEGKFYLVHLREGGFLALYRNCPHLGCVVLWNTQNERFSCPCHGSQFEMNGAVTNPPAPRPLVRFPVTFEDGLVKVDTGTPIERDRVNGDDAVFPAETTS